MALRIESERAEASLSSLLVAVPFTSDLDERFEKNYIPITERRVMKIDAVEGRAGKIYYLLVHAQRPLNNPNFLVNICLM